MNIRHYNWCGHDIRFVEKNGEWWAIVEDITIALNDSPWTGAIERELDTSLLIEVNISKKANKPDWKLVVNEIGLYDILLNSNCLEARKFRRWTGSVLQRLRKRVGLAGYEVMRMTEPEIQEDIDHILDTLFYDEETGQLMQSVTVQGGDVEQVPFEE